MRNITSANGHFHSYPKRSLIRWITTHSVRLTRSFLRATQVAPLVIGAVMICLLGIITAFRSDAHTTQVHQNSPTSVGPGISAIQPTQATGTQRFTVSDVKAFIQRHPAPPRMVLEPGKVVKLLRADFVSSREASQRMHGEWIGLPDSAIVCYVELQGPFLLNHISTPLGAKPFPPSNTAIEVFDAKTGNLLVAGFPG